MKTYCYFLLLLLITSCTISSVQDKENITTYDPMVDISHIEFEGGNGTSPDQAILILKARNANEALASEYAYLKKKFGEPNAEWKILQIRSKGQKTVKFDVLKIKDLETGSIHTFYFSTGRLISES